MEIKKVGVAGCGLMGGGIAQVSAQSGYEVVVLEMEERFLEKGLGAIENNLSKLVAKEKISKEQKDAISSRIKGTTKVEDLADCDIIIEAIIENPEVKRELFGKLDVLCPEHTIFCSNTSSIPIIEMAVSTTRPKRFLGMHFFNPVPAMKLVEIIRTLITDEEVVTSATAFAQSLGKTTVNSKDRAGFIVNLLLFPYLLDAVRALEAGVATMEDIDSAMKLGCGHPMGPFALLDMVGLDTTCFICEVLYNEFKDPKYAAPPILSQMVKAGMLGKKSGKGFYNYSK